MFALVCPAKCQFCSRCSGHKSFNFFGHNGIQSKHFQAHLDWTVSHRIFHHQAHSSYQQNSLSKSNAHWSMSLQSGLTSSADSLRLSSILAFFIDWPSLISSLLFTALPLGLFQLLLLALLLVPVGDICHVHSCASRWAGVMAQAKPLPTDGRPNVTHDARTK